MTDASEGGASIAWRLLATLEGGSLLLATSALLAYTASCRTARTRRRTCKTVLLTNTTSDLGGDIKRRLELHGCTVSTITSGATSDAVADAGSDSKFDALIVVGAKPKSSGLNGISDLVTEDAYVNIKLLESLSIRVDRGGSIAWASAGAGAEAGAAPGAFTGAAAAFDSVLQANLQHVAKVYSCKPIWVGRCDAVAERVVAALMSPDTPLHVHGFSVRNAATKVGEYLYRWLKTIT